MSWKVHFCRTRSSMMSSKLNNYTFIDDVIKTELGCEYCTVLGSFGSAADEHPLRRLRRVSREWRWSSKSWRHPFVWVSRVSGRPHVANRPVEHERRASLISHDVLQTTTALQESWCLLHHGLSGHVRESCVSRRPHVAERVLPLTSSLISIDRNTMTTPLNAFINDVIKSELQLNTYIDDVIKTEFQLNTFIIDVIKTELQLNTFINDVIKNWITVHQWCNQNVISADETSADPVCIWNENIQEKMRQRKFCKQIKTIWK